MPTVYIRTNPYPSNVGTSRTVTIPTTPATLLVMDSGYMGWQLVNVGVATLTYGDSSMLAGTGSFLFYSMEKTWYPVADTMSVYLRADSVAGIVLINEFL